MPTLDELCVAPETTVEDVMRRLNANTRGIVLVVDGDRRLLGTITDGDIRRAVLGGIATTSTAAALLAGKPPEAAHAPVTAAFGTSAPDLLALMVRQDVRHVPLVEDGRVRDVALLSDLIKETVPRMRAVVMAGGRGTRLRPLTEAMPKSMLPIGDRPLLERIIGRLQKAGIHRVNLATHYKSDSIREHFGDGRAFDVDIKYVDEHEPLGTAGAIALLAESDEPLLVMNGDILTHVDFAAMLDFHRTHRADMTVAVRPSELHVPYGVVENDGVEVVRISEKPVMRYFVNAGIYLLNPDVCRLITPGQKTDMPDVIAMLIAQRRRVVSFPIHEYWLDIGRQDDYLRALADAESGEV